MSAVLTERHLCSQLLTSPFHLLLSVCKVSSGKFHSHFIRQIQQPVCARNLFAAEGMYKQGMLLNKIIHYRIVQSDWAVRSGWRPLHNHIIYILLVCDTVVSARDHLLVENQTQEEGNVEDQKQLQDPQQTGTRLQGVFFPPFGK